MKTDEQTELAQRIKAGELKFNNQNLEKVKEGYYVAIKWNQLFTGAILENLPDPDDFEGQEKIFEEWLVACFVDHGRDEAQVRAALARAREEVLRDEGE